MEEYNFEPQNGGYMEEDFLFQLIQLGDFQVPAVNLPGWNLFWNQFPNCQKALTLQKWGNTIGLVAQIASQLVLSLYLLMIYRKIQPNVQGRPRHQL